MILGSEESKWKFEERNLIFLGTAAAFAGLALLSALLGQTLLPMGTAALRGEFERGDRLIAIAVGVAISLPWVLSVVFAWLTLTRLRVTLDSEGFTPPVRHLRKPNRLSWEQIDWMELTRRGADDARVRCLVHTVDGRWFGFDLAIFPNSERREIAELLSLVISWRSARQGWGKPTPKGPKFIST